MGLNLSNIYQRPYINKDGRNSVRKKEDEESSKSAAQTEQEEQSGGQNSRSRGLNNIEQRTTSGYTEIKPEQWQQMYAQSQAKKSAVTINTNTQTTVNTQQYNTQNTQTATTENFLSGRSSNINIAQILKDFNNTAIAIGTPEDLKQEVDGYLSLIQTQVTKENPNKNLIKSNLKNASTILDGYISETLDKESKVVENWVDALFLQQIDFKYNEEDINPQFLVKFPKGSAVNAQTTEETAAVDEETDTSESSETVLEETLQTTASSTGVSIPEDSELKSLFIQSKKLAYANEPKKAIETFQKALARAEEVGDTETKSKIYYEVGQIYDDYNHMPQALKSYDMSIQNTTDNNIKTKAHYSMAQIYDDGNQIEPALDHYFVSISFGGESENLAAQSTSLTKIGNIFSDMYEQDAFDYYDAATYLAAETENSKVKGFVASSTARAYEKFGEPEEALKSYSSAVQNYTKANSPQKAAQNYLSAADIMIDFNSTNKANGLLNKAKKYAEQANDTGLLEEINSRLQTLNV